ncbi:MAG: PQQ-dependent sugar dehydrogenase [Bdellovibrionaceae bacterium]|nr:PQQ-dependent sugar dehydrogenase [Pseudobdellovibrionaceae bacterium]
MRWWWLLGTLLLVHCAGWKKTEEANRLPAGKVLDSSGYLYDPNDRSCDGFPRLMVDTMPGTCLGLVMPRDRALDPASKKGFIKPRTILSLKGTDDFLVVDMGGWAPKNGRLFWMRRAPNGGYDLKLVKDALDNPHGLSYGPDGLIYLGEKQRIVRFQFHNGRLLKEQAVITDLAAFEGHMHPLAQFVFDPRNGDLYINSGAPSDHCFVRETGNYAVCPEEFSQGMGSILRVPWAHIKNPPAGGARFREVAASGLRNSMAMVIHPSGVLVQGENSRDFPEAEEPYEEINVVDLSRRGFHYGWPYCYNFHATSPEWLFSENAKSPLRRNFTKPMDCAKPVGFDQAGGYMAPHALMPPHVAPLHMNYYDGAMFADLFGGQLLMSWHGHQPSGHRFVAYRVDERGRPLTEKARDTAAYRFNRRGACPASTRFQPRGGMIRHAPYTEVISGWWALKGARPRGAPVGFTQGRDGSLWIVEDRENRVVVRLARDNGHQGSACASGAGEAPDPGMELLAWRHAVKSDPVSLDAYQKIQQKLIQPYCTGCHGDLKNAGLADDRFSNLDFLVNNDWLEAGVPERSRFYGAIARLEGYTPMPPRDKKQFHRTREGDEILRVVQAWIRGLPADLDQRQKKSVISALRNLRARPGDEGGEVCGRLLAQDPVFVDPRPSSLMSAGGFDWAKVYLPPGHSRLFPGKCPLPEDGVYYVAVRKTGTAASVIPVF